MLAGVALISPFTQPVYAYHDEPAMRIAMPTMLSLAGHPYTFHGYVPCINDIIIGGYPLPNGTSAPSLDESMTMGRMAVDALAVYRYSHKEGDTAAADTHRHTLTEIISHLGYGYVSEAEQVVPFIPMC